MNEIRYKLYNTKYNCNEKGDRRNNLDLNINSTKDTNYHRSVRSAGELYVLPSILLMDENDIELYLNDDVEIEGSDGVVIRPIVYQYGAYGLPLPAKYDNEEIEIFYSFADLRERGIISIEDNKLIGIKKREREFNKDLNRQRVIDTLLYDIINSSNNYNHNSIINDFVESKYGVILINKKDNEYKGLLVDIIKDLKIDIQLDDKINHSVSYLITLYQDEIVKVLDLKFNQYCNNHDDIGNNISKLSTLINKYVNNNNIVE